MQDGQTRDVVTRDLLRRAGRAAPAEQRALQFWAVHLNLSLVGEVGSRLGISAESLAGAEPAALGALARVVSDFDPYGEADFTDVATTYLERCLRRRVECPTYQGAGRRWRHRRLAQRLALAIAGTHS